MVIFSFDVGHERVELSVRCLVPLNDDQWHRVEAEKNIKEVVLQLDGQYREVRPTPPQGHTKLEFYSDLYVGEAHMHAQLQTRSLQLPHMMSSFLSHEKHVSSDRLILIVHNKLNVYALRKFSFLS